MKLVGFDTLAKMHEIALVRGWRSWQQRSPHTLITGVSQNGEFQLERLRIRNTPTALTDWIIHNIRIDHEPTFVGDRGLSGIEFSNLNTPLVMHAGSRFEIEVEYVGALPEGALFEAALIGTRIVETSDHDPTTARSMGIFSSLAISSERPIRWSVPRGLRFLVMLGEEQWLFYRDKAEIRAVSLAGATELERTIADEWIADERRIHDDGPQILDEPIVVSMHLRRDEEREMLCAMDDRHGKCLFSVGREGASFAATYVPGGDMPAWLEAR